MSEDLASETLQANKKQKVEHHDKTAPVCQGYGKLILLGEHFVVYKVPALVVAVGASTTCKIEASKQAGLHFTDDRPAVPGYKTKKMKECVDAAELVLRHFGIDTTKQGIHVHLGGDLCAVSGIGASAAQCVSMARAIGHFLGRCLSDEEVNDAGYEGEKGYHGTPSGIDNTASTYGGLLKFQRTDSSPMFEMKKLTHSVEVVYASTGITASTTEVVGDVRKRKQAEPAWFEDLTQKYVALIPKAEDALQTGDWLTLGEQLNQNHTLCQDLSVSCEELDKLVDAARTAGAYGAKMSGTGRGGLMLALTPGAGLQKKVAAALEAAGAAQVWSTIIQ